MTMQTSVRRALGACGLVIALASQALAQDAPSPRWRFSMTPIAIWGVGIKGDATVRNISSDVDVSFDKLFEHLQGAAGVNVAATKGRWGWAFALNYFKVGEDDITTGVTSPLDVWMKWLSVEGSATYGVVANPDVQVTALAGVRYSGLKGKIESNNGVINVESKTQDWIDPFIGGRIAKPWGRFALALSGDVGGFDISENTSKLSWTIFPQASWQFPISGGKKALILTGGYRYSSIDFNGKGPQEFQMDVDIQGPAIGLTIAF